MITRILSSGKTLKIEVDGTLVIAKIDGTQVSTGGLTKIPAAMANRLSGFAMIAAAKIPVTAEEAEKIQNAIDLGRRAINKKIKSAKAYNNLMNEGAQGYTPHKF